MHSVTKETNVVSVEDLLIEDDKIFAVWPDNSRSRILEISVAEAQTMQEALRATAPRWHGNFKGQRVSVISVQTGAGFALKIGKATKCQILISNFRGTDVEKKEACKALLTKLGREICDGTTAFENLPDRRSELMRADAKMVIKKPAAAAAEVNLKRMNQEKFTKTLKRKGSQTSDDSEASMASHMSEISWFDQAGMDEPPDEMNWL